MPLRTTTTDRFPASSAFLLNDRERATVRRISDAVQKLERWLRERDYAGYEPFDLMNSPYLGRWARQFPLPVLIRQFGRRYSGLWTRKLLRVSPGKNCKALGLALAAYVDLARAGTPTGAEQEHLQSELRRLRSPGETEYAWGYDWDAYSMRAGNVMPAYSPNAIATTFCGHALLDRAETAGDGEARQMAISAARFFIARLNRSVDTVDELCFSYAPTDRTRIYNSTALVSAYLARVAALTGDDALVEPARRSMRYLIGQQQPDGSWYYGESKLQKWIDSFHTGYNLESLLLYRQLTGETFADEAIRSGYDYYGRTFFRHGGIPAYYHDRLYPIDIHCLTGAMLTFCAFRNEDPAAFGRALEIADWTLDHMRGSDGAFFYQRHRFWVNRTPFLRWAEAWAFHALARLERVAAAPGAETPADY